MKEITRFAPSPTGYLHIGGARTALFNYLLAKKSKGKFILRVEDTDYNRNNIEATKEIIKGMNWVGMTPDVGPIYQSQRIDGHKRYIKKLLEEGKAYYCDCNEKHLKELRDQARKEKRTFHYSKTCLNKNKNQGAVRLKVPENRIIEWKDTVKGKITINTSELDDFVIARSDGTPIYHFAVVCDDYEMGVTTVLRGDDHVYNTPKQILIYEALGWTLPKFGHVPLVYGSDKTKMSKRHGATSVIDYKNMGYLPDALVNYLARLSWSHGNQELFTREELFKKFDANKINTSPPVFDFKKLDWINQEHMKSTDPKIVLNHVWEHLPTHLDNSKKEIALNLLPSIIKRCKKTTDVAKLLLPILEGPKYKKFDIETLPDNATHILERIISHSSIRSGILEKDSNMITIGLKDVMNSFNLKPKVFYPIFNLAIYGAPIAPDTINICINLGREEVSRRINTFITQIRGDTYANSK